jgi:hypothetical protein
MSCVWHRRGGGGWKVPSDLKGLVFIFIDLLNEFPYVIGPSYVLFRKMTA